MKFHVIEPFGVRVVNPQCLMMPNDGPNPWAAEGRRLMAEADRKWQLDMKEARMWYELWALLVVLACAPIPEQLIYNKPLGLPIIDSGKRSKRRGDYLELGGEG